MLMMILSINSTTQTKYTSSLRIGSFGKIGLDGYHGKIQGKLFRDCMAPSKQGAYFTMYVLTVNFLICRSIFPWETVVQC